ADRTDRILLEPTEPGRSLARVEHRDAAAGRVSEPSRLGRDARQALEQIERGAFAGEEGARRARHLGGLLSRSTPFAVTFPQCDADPVVELAKGLAGNIQTGEDAFGLDDEDAARA